MSALWLDTLEMCRLLLVVPRTNCMTTKVVNIYHKIPYDVYIGRPGKGQEGYYGNPVKVSKDPCEFCSEIHSSPAETRECYKEYFYCRIEIDSEFRERILELKGKVLGCFCKPKFCHGDIICEWLNKI